MSNSDKESGGDKPQDKTGEKAHDQAPQDGSPTGDQSASVSPEGRSKPAATAAPSAGHRRSKKHRRKSGEISGDATAADADETAPQAEATATGAASAEREDKLRTARKATGTSAGGEPPRPSRSKRGWGRFFLWLLVLLLVGGLVAGGLWLGKRELEARSQAVTNEVEQLRRQLVSADQQLTELSSQLERQHDQALSESREQAERQQALVQRLQDMEQALARNTSRIRALSTTTREDWLLAEAEYLLKLANQRMVIERSTEAAIALLQQADKILRDLDNPDLMPLRRAIARDLTKLKLADEVDLEGLYLRLASLAEGVPELPVRQNRQGPKPQQDSEPTDAPANNEALSWWQRPLNTLQDMFSDLDDYIRVRDHSERPKPILPPDAEQYLQQNLRLMLEKAQLAALRGETPLYRDSLRNVIQWAQRYYPDTPTLNNFISEVRALAEVDVQMNLPDISQSRQLLTDYIDRLHKLKGVENADTRPNAEAQQ